jgi:hypothetical protein
MLQHVLAVGAGGGREGRVHRERRRRLDQGELRLHQNEIHAKAAVGAQDILVRGRGEANAFRRRVGAGAIDQF